MTPAADRIRCPLCGGEYSEQDGAACQPGCPLSSGCRLLRCPYCGYEIPAPTRLTRWLAARWRKDSRA